MSETYAESFLREVKAQQELEALGYRLEICDVCQGKTFLNAIEKAKDRTIYSAIPCNSCEQRGSKYVRRP